MYRRHTVSTSCSRKPTASTASRSGRCPLSADLAFNRKDLTRIAGLSAGEIRHLLVMAASFEDVLARDVKKVPTLRGKSVVLLFFEPSTRTRTSFEIAGKVLSADTVNITASSSSAVKGETLYDTVRNIEAMKVDAIVMRHASSGAADYIASRTGAAVVNAGDGCHEHPTQALLDLLTMERFTGRTTGLTVAIVGDVLHSRVARSNLHALTTLGNTVRFVGPRTLVPPGLASLGAEVCHDLREGIRDADVVMMLRIQKERMGSGFYPSEREYCRSFGLTADALRHAGGSAIVMHPGPVNRGLEITRDVLESPRCVVYDQVTRGVAVRMSVLYALLAGGKGEHPHP